MELKTYLRGLDHEAKVRFAQACGTTLNHLKNVAYGAKSAGESLAIGIDRESGGAVRCEDLRPDVDWAYLRGSAPRGGDCPPARAEAA